jgi:hypothetical protein
MTKKSQTSQEKLHSSNNIELPNMFKVQIGTACAQHHDQISKTHLLVNLICFLSYLAENSWLKMEKRNSLIGLSLAKIFLSASK